VAASEDDDEDGIVIGVFTKCNIQWIEQTWGKKFKDVLYIGDPLEKNVVIPNYHVAKSPKDVPCASTLYPLCCKLEYFYKMAYKQYPHKKWFIRVEDNTWIHHTNLIQFLAKCNGTNVPYYEGYGSYMNYLWGKAPQWSQNKPIWGEVLKFCSASPGWIINKVVLKRIQKSWDLYHFMSKKRPCDAVVFGWLLNELKLSSSDEGPTPDLAFNKGASLNLEEWNDSTNFCANKDKPVMLNSSETVTSLDLENLFFHSDLKDRCK